MVKVNQHKNYLLSEYVEANIHAVDNNSLLFPVLRISSSVKMSIENKSIQFQICKTYIM